MSIIGRLRPTFNNTIKIILGIVFIFLIFEVAVLPYTATAHQPRVVESEQIVVSNPEISKAYYGKLSGKPHIYTIFATEEFDFYINVLVPDIEGQKKAVSVEIFKGGESIVVVDASKNEWEKFFEPFGQSTYWKGPEYRKRAEAGEYKILISSNEKNIKYSLAIGEIELFDLKEGINALLLIPDLKRNFFNESSVSFIFSPLGWGYILVVYIFAFAVGYIYRATLKKLAQNSLKGLQKNIGRFDRIIRLFIWLALLFGAITTSWNPILLFLSGFALFEALFSWCGIFAALGKNTNPEN
jgi:hypothetical protein